MTRRSWAVAHVPDGAALAPRRPAGGVSVAPPQALRFHLCMRLPDATANAVYGTRRGLDDAEQAAAIEAAAAAAMASAAPLELDTRDWRERAADNKSEPATLAFDRYDALRDEVEGTDRFGHRLLGYPISVQDDATEEAGVDRVLLQLDSHGSMGWDFVGSGVLYVCIAEADLARAHLGAVVAIGQR